MTASDLISGLAVLVSIFAYAIAHRASDRSNDAAEKGNELQAKSNELQARVVELEEARERERQASQDRAQLTPELTELVISRIAIWKLRVKNHGPAPAWQVRARLDGKPVRLAKPAPDVGKELLIEELGVGPPVEYTILISAPLSTAVIELDWLDRTGAPQSFRTVVTAQRIVR